MVAERLVPDPALSYAAADTSIDLDLRPVGQVLADHAATRPDHPALLWPGAGDLTCITYRQQLLGATALALRLVRAVGPGRRVAVMAAGSPDWVLLEYAAALAGIALVPLNPNTSDPELAYMLGAAGADLLLADEVWRGRPLLERVAPFAAAAGTAVHLLSAWSELPASTGRLAPVDPRTPMLVQFTSGTTGRPKGAVLSQMAALNCAALQLPSLGAGPDEIWCNLMPLHHVGGSVSVLLAILAAGATMTMLPAFDPGGALELFERTSTTVTGAVPTMQLAMLSHARFPTTDLSALRVMTTGGSTVPTSLIRRV